MQTSILDKTEIFMDIALPCDRVSFACEREAEYIVLWDACCDEGVSHCFYCPEHFFDYKCDDGQYRYICDCEREVDALSYRRL